MDNSGSTAYETSRDENIPGEYTSGQRVDTRSVVQKYTDTEVWSDVGVRPNYETIEGFWLRNPTAQQCAVDIFINDFLICEDWY